MDQMMRPRSLMNFALRCVRIFPGIKSRAELVTLDRPGLTPVTARSVINLKY